MNGQLTGAQNFQGNLAKSAMSNDMNLLFIPIVEMYNINAVGSYLVRSAPEGKIVYDVRDSTMIFDAVRKLKEQGPRPISEAEATIAVAYLG